MHGELMREAKETARCDLVEKPRRDSGLFFLQEREEQVFLSPDSVDRWHWWRRVVVAFILLTERFGAGCTPRAAQLGGAVGSVTGSLGRNGLSVVRYFPVFAAVVVPQTKAALYRAAGEFP